MSRQRKISAKRHGRGKMLQAETAEEILRLKKVIMMSRQRRFYGRLNMNSKYYEYLVVMAEELNFSRAAKKLGVSQPRLSQAIQKIENETGVKVFDRSSNPLKLTDAGKIVVETGRKICCSTGEMYTALAELKDSESGVLTIGASPFRSSNTMPGIIRKFRERYPNVKVVIREKKVSELLGLAMSGDLDMAISTFPIDEDLFEYRNMPSEEIFLAVPENFEINRTLQEKGLLTKKADKMYPVVDIKDVAELDFVILGEGQFLGDFFRNICNSTGINPFAAVTCEDIFSAYAMVEAGVGATIIPSSILQRLDQNRGMKYYSIKQAECQRQIAVIYRKGQYLTAYAEEMLKLITNGA